MFQLKCVLFVWVGLLFFFVYLFLEHLSAPLPPPPIFLQQPSEIFFMHLLSSHCAYYRHPYLVL